MTSRHACTLALVSALAAAGSTAAAQEKGATISGVVRDSAGTPIEMAEIRIAGTKLRTTSGLMGQFRLDDVPAGKFWFGVRRMGYAPLMTAITLRNGGRREFDVQLEPLPIGLSEVKVKARSGYSGTGRYADFERRRRVAWGSFITRDDIAREKPPSLSWMLTRYLPGYSPYDLDNAWQEFDESRFTQTSMDRTSFGRSRGCGVGVSVNGGMPMGWGLNEFQPNDVEAIEVYRGRTSHFPAEFAHYGRSYCNLIVVWLRES